MSTLSGYDPDFPEVPNESSGSGCRGLVVRFLFIVCALVLLSALLLPAYRSARWNAKRAQCLSNMKQIMLALNNYAEDQGSLPPAYSVDANGRPLHSWRTLILPYLEHRELYDSIDLKKPWNDPANAKAFETVASVYDCPCIIVDPAYSCPELRGKSWNKTVYRASVGPHAFLRPTEPRPLATITDDPAWTLSVIEVDQANAVPWMAPEDADAAMILRPGADLKLQHPGGVNAAFADGSAVFLKTTVAPEVRRAMISVDGGEAVSREQVIK
ncbi:DUF1559 family PulG-like putative transporter [Paludisphaera rhizosphaerae]|uniref:DUF1559 family PulG-like putative transporter n=1 Tax=Paludisphaera rhizosphaerae TaxID=2711216 RepID=UPI0013E9E767|nr:DUF1559 domain-containing protein [Paludisphaera rhizosphaerae]